MEDFFNIGTLSIQGDRDYQDDYFETKKLDNKSSLLILADGMGGYAGGRVASETVVDSFNANFDKSNPNIKEALNNALIKANETLATEKKNQPKLNQMGTTLIAVYITQSFMQWVSVGDSPLWILRRDRRLHQYKIERINKNHSIAGLLELQYQHGEITKEERDTSPNRHMLTSAITGDELKSIDLSKRVSIEEGDIFILATDGVETLEESEIKEIVLKSKDNAEATKDILDAVVAKKSDNQDNSTIIVVSPKEVLKDVSNDIPNSMDNQTDKNPKPFYSQILSLDKMMYLGYFIVVILSFILINELMDDSDNRVKKEKLKEDKQIVVQTPQKKIDTNISKIQTQVKHKETDVIKVNTIDTNITKDENETSSKKIEIEVKEDNTTTLDSSKKKSTQNSIVVGVVGMVKITKEEFHRPSRISKYLDEDELDDKVYDEYTEDLNKIKN